VADVAVTAWDEVIADLIARRTRPAYRLAYAILLDGAEAEDAVQDACLVAWRRRASLRDADRFEAWFDRILINGSRDRIRRRRRQRVRAIALVEVARGGSIAPPQPEPDLDEALDQLDADHRLVVLLRYWQDLPLEAISERLGIPLGTVKSRLHYATRAMRDHLEKSRG
jgi:RNA polymerase sigma-70 factor (ECF subfamily)